MDEVAERGEAFGVWVFEGVTDPSSLKWEIEYLRKKKGYD